MKSFGILAAVLLTVNAFSDVDHWQNFKIKFNRTYQSLREDKLRFNIFKNSLQIIRNHNAKYDKGEMSYFLRVNQFADLTHDEFVKKYFTAPMPRQMGVGQEFVGALNLSAIPDSIDWRKHNAVTSVKNQGGCGSCYSFSVIGALEGQYAIKHKQLVPLSNQELVDCSRSYGNDGCGGGQMTFSYNYIKDKGISTESSYPYKAKQGICKPGTRANVKVTGYRNINRSLEALKEAVGTIGPISAGVTEACLQFYGGGIFRNPSCFGATKGHAILVVGYGKENGKDYWLVKNSWGLTWGEKGYIKISNSEASSCQLHRVASYPLIA